MKLFLPVLASSLFLAKFATGQIVQTYYVPLPEADLDATFVDINSDAAIAVNIQTLISIAVAANNTVIYYDHWEDGYDPDPINNPQSTTEIWGDLNPTNGEKSGVMDMLASGTAIILDNPIPLDNRNLLTTPMLYDGRDRILATLPIAVTRSAFPNDPGSLMAGAVEVFNQDEWGTKFEAPVGEDTVGSNTVSTIISGNPRFVSAHIATNIVLSFDIHLTIFKTECIPVDCFLRHGGCRWNPSDAYSKGWQ